MTAQLRAELPLSVHDPRLFHLRDANGRHEVDLVVELNDGRVIGIEIKADSAPDADAARHLSWLAESLGDRFAVGIVFHTGPRPLRFGDSVIGLPICALWGGWPCSDLAATCSRGGKHAARRRPRLVESI